MSDSRTCARHGCRKPALRRFCSDRCRIAHHNARRQPAPKVRITCQGCGSVFQGRPDQKTCSATCRSRLFRAKHLALASQSPALGDATVDWNLSTPFSPAELRQKVQTQKLESGVNYSWLPTSPKRIRVKKPRQHDDQLNFDFEPGGSLPEQ